MIAVQLCSQINVLSAFKFAIVVLPKFIVCWYELPDKFAGNIMMIEISVIKNNK